MRGDAISRWDWLLGSLLLATAASLLHWLLHYLAGADSIRQPFGRIWPSVLRLVEAPWIALPARLVYAIGIPAAALFWQGALSARGLGLKSLGATRLAFPGVDDAAQDTVSGHMWGEDISAFVVVAGVTALAVAAGSYLARRNTSHLPATRSPGGERSLGTATVDAVYHQVHWAFYREPFVFGWGIGLGSWLGALPVLLETGVSLMFWEQLRARGAIYQRRVLVRAGLFAAGTQLYLLTQNLWLAIVLDAFVGWLALRWSDRPGVPDQSATSEAITTIR